VISYSSINYVVRNRTRIDFQAITQFARHSDATVIDSWDSRDHVCSFSF